MLPEPLRLLIRAFATGDLSPRRRSAAVRLLRHSAEARRLLKELKANRRRLRALAPPALPLDFASRVVMALPEMPPIIRPSVLATTTGNGTSRAARYAAAATVLIAVAIGAYLFGSLPRDGSIPSQSVANRTPVKAGATAVPDIGADEVAENAGPPTPPDGAEPERAVAKNPPEKTNPDVPAPVPDPLGTTSAPPPKLMRVLPPRLLMFPLRELDAADGQKKLQKELNRADDLHIDLFCKDCSKGFERLQTALRSRGLRLVVDGVAQEAVKRKLRAQYLVYCDDLTADEWGRVLRALAVADKEANDNLFDHVVVLPFDAADPKDLTAIVGSDLTQPVVRRPRAGGAVKTNDRQALMAIQAPVRTSSASKDVRQFLEARTDRAGGDIAVVLVLRMTGA